MEGEIKMSNEIINTEARELRDIETVTDEILDLCHHAQHMMLIYAVEIGRRLVEAKEILPHGEWGEWLKNRVQFSQSTANKHMQIFKKFGSSQLSLFGAELKSETFTNLSYSQALKLIAVPDEELEEFVKTNDVSDMTTRELDKVIRERDEALKLAELAVGYEAAKAEAENKLAAAVEDAQKHQEKIDKLREQNKKLKELVKNPEIPKEKVDELRAELKTELDKTRVEDIEKATADIAAELAEAEAERAAALAEAEAARSELDVLRKQIVMSDPAVTEFKAQFNTAQDTLNKLVSAFGKISDTSIKEKFTAAVKAMFDKFTGEFKV